MAFRFCRRVMAIAERLIMLFLGKAILTFETKDNEHDVWTYILKKGKTSIRKALQHPTYGFSLRCVKNK